MVEVRGNQIPHVLFRERNMSTEGMHVGTTCVDERDSLPSSLTIPSPVHGVAHLDRAYRHSAGQPQLRPTSGNVKR